MPVSISELIKKARSELAQLTQLDVSTTLGAAKEGNEWVVSVELVEKHS
ncbi:MAG: gas vesicle protein, partial [Actinobacteria bacterium]|nr:gas vesicle protein [Actinomycetota bacterium]